MQINVSTKNCVDSEISKQRIVDGDMFVKKSGDTMIGPLIIPKDNYPVQGNTNKVVI